MQKNSFIIRTLFYVLGILALTFGIALTIEANLGASPIDALLVGLFNNFGLSIGSWEYIIALFLLVINAIVSRKKPQILALSTAFLVGTGIDFWLKIFVPFNHFDSLWTTIPALMIGTVFCSFGIATYLQADFLPSPFDESMMVISKKLKVSLFWAKTILMGAFLVMAFLFQGPIAIGTILIMLMSGPIIAWFYPRMEAFKIKTMEVL